MAAPHSHPRISTLAWIGGVNGYLRLLDQTLLPGRVEFRDCHTVEQVWEAIKTLRVRGAPAIGVAAAFGAVLGAAGPDLDQAADAAERACDYLATARPTAINLAWALERMRRLVREKHRLVSSLEALRQALLEEAQRIQEEDGTMCRAIGSAGAHLIPKDGGVLTHCNAGALATAGEGTALAVLYAAWRQGRRFQVFADETRPLLQGARLTAWELQRAGIPCTLLCDSMAAQVMKEGRIQLVIVGADRIAASGDTANKIGTYGVAVLARFHGIPFYVAAPSSTFDLALASGEAIPIEQRAAREVTHGFGQQTAPEGVNVYNPAFDVTPAGLITGIITEKGLIQPVNVATIAATMGS